MSEWAELKTRSQTCLQNWMWDRCGVLAPKWSPAAVKASFENLAGWEKFAKYPNVGPVTVRDVDEWLSRHCMMTFKVTIGPPVDCFWRA